MTREQRRNMNYKTKLDVLMDIFGKFIEDYPYTTNGNCILIRLDGDRRIKITLYNSWCVDDYDSIIFEVVSKTHGKIDTNTIYFKSVFRYPQDVLHPNKIAKYIWRDNNAYSWYGVATDEDYAALVKELENYVGTWE